MTPDNLQSILYAHAKWLRGDGGERADLYRAYLRGANLGGADLRGADLRGADLPSPTMVLLASWETVSDDLTRDLMRFDAACHPVGAKAFTAWANGGPCPYGDVRVQRAANFTERKECWSPGKPPRPYLLMARVLDECCPGWRGEDND